MRHILAVTAAQEIEEVLQGDEGSAKTADWKMIADGETPTDAAYGRNDGSEAMDAAYILLLELWGGTYEG